MWMKYASGAQHNGLRSASVCRTPGLGRAVCVTWVCLRTSAAPGAEECQHLVARARCDRLVRNVADGANRLAHLLQIRVAAVAGVEMALDHRAFVSRQHVFEVGRHQLNELSANDVVGGRSRRSAHGCSDKYGSKAARTLDLARWSRT